MPLGVAWGAQMLKKYFKPLNNTGDTIIEVLIVLGILGFAFTISSATASRGLNKSRNAAEHSQALGIVNSQIELLRQAVSKKTNVALSMPFCMNGTNPKPFAPSYGATVPANAADDVLTNYPPECTSNNLYHQSITYDAGSGYFTLRTRWDSIGNLGSQQELMTYRVHELTEDADSGIPVSPSAPQITVRVLKIAPNAGNTTPDCSKIATDNHGNDPVTITQLNGAGGTQAKTTSTGGSTAVFNGVVDFGRYQITAASPGNVVCPPLTTTVTLTPDNNTPTIDFKIQPQCQVVHHPPVSGGVYSDTPAYAHYHYEYFWSHGDYPGHGNPGGYYFPPSVTGLQYYNTENGYTVRYDRFGVPFIPLGGRYFYNRFVLIPVQIFDGFYSDTPAYEHFIPVPDTNECTP